MAKRSLLSRCPSHIVLANIRFMTEVLVNLGLSSTINHLSLRHTCLRARRVIKCNEWLSQLVGMYEQAAKGLL